MTAVDRNGVALAVLVLALLFAGTTQGGDPVANAKGRKPATETELQYWLQNMVWDFRFAEDEIQAATGLSAAEIKAGLEKFKITRENKPARAKDALLNMQPWPGGRRISNTSNSRVESARQRDTKVGVITPWDESSYAVLDMPEVLYVARDGDAGRKILYVAHYIGDSTWEKDENLRFDPIEWQRTAENVLETGRKFPKGRRYSSEFSSKFVAFRNAVRMKITLSNKSDGVFRGPQQVQNCVFMKALKGGFGGPDSKDVISDGYHARSSSDGKQWLIIAWVPLTTSFGFCPGACWGNPVMPCCHSDPQFKDCAPGESQSVYGWFSFYEGEDIQGELIRIDKTGWKEDKWDEAPAWSDASVGYR